MRVFGVIACLLLVSPAVSSDVSIFTSTRYVTSLASAPDGTLWAGTMGGVLRRDVSGKWSKYTIQHGLPSHEITGISVRDGKITAVTPIGEAVYDGTAWITQTSKSGLTPETVNLSVIWNGKEYSATLEGILVKEGQRTTSLPLPQSRGTHITSLLPHGKVLRVSIFGDGIWEYDGKSWSHGPPLPRGIDDITALAGSGNTLWIGTHRNGIWEHDGKSWKQHLQPDEPYDHNCQCMAVYKNSLFISTLENGLVVKTGRDWNHITVPEITSNAPRQMVQYKDRLYVRHGNGKVDVFDGGVWKRDVLSSVLPRKQASTIASDGRVLYAAQWGGWSEFDGRNWSHHLKESALQGCPITVIYPDGDTIWTGTQNRGLMEYNRTKGAMTPHDERTGMPDDWIKCILKVKDRIYVGTFVGGLAWRDGGKWKSEPRLTNTEITDMAPDGSGALMIATRKGLHRLKLDNTLQTINSLEVQSLLLTESQLWLGTRTGLLSMEALGK